MFKRIIILILDACGVGELPDAMNYGDKGAATLPNIARQVGGLIMPNCQKLGLGNIVPIKGLEPVGATSACYGKMTELSPGKDSTTGHWEIGGVILDKPFPVYPEGFPGSLVGEFEALAKISTIGNIPASGTEIIDRLGARHMETGELILYTSADSVFQLAAHEEIIPLARLYEICAIARAMLVDEYPIGRVIARPFTGRPGKFVRTANRKDFSLPPPSPTFLDIMQAANIPTVSIGKISDLFANKGFSKAIKTGDNMAVIDKVIDELGPTEYGLIFGNLVDFDMLWGHRNDVAAFAEGLADFDRQVPRIIASMKDDDLLVITADHGCDPTILGSTDHTREYVPLIAYNRRIAKGADLGTRKTFSDIAATVAENFKLDYTFPGSSFVKDIINSMGK